MSCPIKAHIPEKVWTTDTRPIKTAAEVQVGLMGHIKNVALRDSNFIIVWVGNTEIGAISPVLCYATDSISFGPDGTTETDDIPYGGYNVRRWNLNDTRLYMGLVRQ